MPRLHHAMLAALRGQCQAVELAGEADREVADVDHFLHFAEPLGHDLAGFERHEQTEKIISCTSLSPSDTILPASSVTSRPRSDFAARSSSPNSRTSSPRRGAG